MYNIQEAAEEIYDKINYNQNFVAHNSLVIVGDNTSGKSSLLKLLLEKADEEDREDIYYIDALNRIVVDVKEQKRDVTYSKYSVKEILKTRIQPHFFSNEDVFVDGARGGMVTFSELCKDENYRVYNELFNLFFKCCIEKRTEYDLLESEEENLFYNGIEINKISSSEAARIRLIMETNYAAVSKCKVVIIDEFDSHFDTDTLVGLINQMIEVFNDLRFIFVIHNFEVLVRLNNIDALIYNNDATAQLDLRMIDCNDITELGQLYKIRSRYMGARTEQEKLLSECVSEIVKKGNLTEEKKKILIEINRETLNSKCRVLYDYVVESTS